MRRVVGAARAAPYPELGEGAGGRTMHDLSPVRAASATTGAGEDLARQAEIDFARAPNGGTFVARQRVGYPFHVTVPFYLDQAPAGLPTLYLQSVSGGLYEGESIGLDLSVGPGAAAQVTTQASTIVHRADHVGVDQRVEIRVEAEALFEYLPDPLILFPGAQLASRVDARVAEGATLMIADGFGQHDPAGAGGRFDRLANEIRIARPDGTLLALERFQVTGDCAAIHPKGGLAAHGTLMVVSDQVAPEDLVDALRQALPQNGPVYAGASTLPSNCGAAARLLAPDGGTLKRAVTATWTAVRKALTGCPPGVRRK